MRVPITKPWLDETDLASLREPMETGWLVQGPKVAEFERAFAAFAGVPHAVACSSCTTGLHLALAALGVGPGDEVLVPAFTWVATANVVRYCGAEPVFVDVSLDSFNVTAEAFAARLSPRTRALLPVHLFGLPVDMDPVLALAGERGLLVVEDAACGFGAIYRGRHVGAFGAAGAFSFHPRKAITTGEGGMVVTRDPALDPALRVLRDHGGSVSDRTRHEAGAVLLGDFDVMGFNYRMTDLQGALGTSQLRRADDGLARRRARAARYDRLLAGLPWLRTPAVPEGMEHGYQSYVCLVAPEPPSPERADALGGLRDRLMGALEADGVSTRQGTHAVHTLGVYRERCGLRPADLPNAWLAERLSLALPLYATMTDAEQDYVVERLGEAWRAVA